MAVTIRDILNLDVMRDFKVVAGEKGLNRNIAATEILDFEFVEDVDFYRERDFEGNSIALSSLLFAKDQPELILQSVKKLESLNVQALAYKPVFFKELPKEALEYAEKKNFPILEFGRDEFFEDIIFSIGKLIGEDDALGQSEPLIGEMIDREFSPEEAEAACDKLNPLLRPFVCAVCIRDVEISAERAADMLKHCRPDSKLKSKTFAGKYGDLFMVILSQDEDNQDRFRALLDDVLIAYGLAGRELTMGISQVRNLRDQFDRCVREAYWAEKVAEIEKSSVKNYQTMGIYKLITANIHRSSTIDFMEEYLSPLFEEEGREGELLHTAVEYVLTKGDAVAAAEKLFCHKNTIRYRIGKLQEKLDPDTSEKEFYQNLSAAVKIYLLSNQRR